MGQRIAQHRECTFGGFTAKYAVKRLVWFETHSTMEHAIVREKQLKNWQRQWKIALVESDNPAWEHIEPDPGSSPG